MKKKVAKKLALNKESLRNLTEPALETVGGASGFSKCITQCASCINTCQYTCTL